MERKFALLSLAFVGSDGVPSTCTWHTGNKQGTQHYSACPDGRMVSELDWENQDGYGIIGLRYKCFGHRDFYYLGSDQGHNGKFANSDNFTLTGGLVQIQAEEQSGFGIIDVQTFDGQGSHRRYTNNNNGAWRTRRSCASGQVVSGLGVYYQGGYGLVNLCFTCSQYDPNIEVMGGWYKKQSSPATQSVTLTEGVSWSETLTHEESWSTSVTETMNEGFKVDDFSFGVSLSTTDSRQLVTTDSSYFSEQFTQTQSFNFGAGVVWQWRYQVNRASTAMGSGTDFVFVPQFQLSPSEDEHVCCLPGHFLDLTDYQSGCTRGPRLCSTYAEMSAILHSDEEHTGKVWDLNGAGYCHGVKGGTCHTISDLEFDQTTSEMAFNGARSIIVGPNTEAEVRNYGNGQEDEPGVVLSPGKYNGPTLSALGIDGICIVILRNPQESTLVV